MPTPALTLLALLAQPLQVGVTLHPAYSWTAEVTRGLDVTVVPVVPGDVDVGAYQPRPEDVAKLTTLDALVVNGLGHDTFIDEMLRASGNARCVVIRPNDGLALLPSHGGEGMNPHTFLSLSNAAQQTYAIARALGALRPAWRAKLQQNAKAYAARLRALQGRAQQRLRGHAGLQVMTVHDGYGYLLQDLGVKLVGVVEPAHGLVPSAKELESSLALLSRTGTRVVLSEAQFPTPLAKLLEGAGATVVVVSHIATGPHTAQRYEEEMKHNLDVLVDALLAAAPPR